MCDATQMQQHLSYDEDILRLVQRIYQADISDSRLSVIAELEQLVSRHRQMLTDQLKPKNNHGSPPEIFGERIQGS